MLSVEKIITNAHEIEHTDHDEHQNEEPLAVSAPNTQSFNINDPEKHQIAKAHEIKENCITPTILLFALGIHAIFEGIAAGLATNRSECIQLLFAIGIHKWVEAMALGINVVKNMPNHLKLGSLYDTIHALYSPLGILIGVLLENTGNKQIEWIFNALAAGTFLYVGTIEILAEVYENKKDKVKKFLMMVVGIGCICAMQLVKED